MVDPTRIIPARAGFTRGAPAPGGGGQDHPRSRGVYGGQEVGEDARDGSSPLARGLQDAAAEGVHALRIIPARAGFTSPAPVVVPSPSDHPRSRGVYTPSCRIGTLRSGSSPLARGLHDRLPAQGAQDRIIPARAGFTLHERPHFSHPRDHPRSRGVYDPHWEHGIVAEGSSPLARGLHTNRKER